MTDLQGLFNFLRPDPPQGYGAFDVQEQEPETQDCEQCKSYNGEVAEFIVYYKENGKPGILYVCEDCLNDPEAWKGREKIRVTKL